jgi:UDP-glucose 4-epimerase
MNVLVIGGMGAIGSFVTRLLLEMGHRPVIYSRHPDTTLLKDVDPGTYDYAQGDILDLPHFIHSVKNYKVQRIIHLSAIAALDKCQANPLAALKTNVQGTVHVLEVARILGVERVVFASSKRAMGEISGEYGYPTYKPVTEDHPTKPVLVYDITKLASEHLGFNYALNYNVDFIALRFAQTYGPGRLNLWGWGRVFTTLVHAKIIENAMLGKPVMIPHGGDAKEDCIYNKDIAQGLVKACFAQGLKHRLFHLGTGKAFALHDFANAVKKLYPKAQIEIGSGLDYLGMTDFPINCVFDISRAREELGFEPQYDVEAGVKDYVRVMQAQGIQPTYTP